MNPLYSALPSVADKLGISPKDRNRILAAAVGIAIAYSITLPSTAVESASHHYTINHGVGVAKVCSAINEDCVFDLKGAMEFARRFWLYRYQNVHASPVALFMTGGNFFEILSGQLLQFSISDVESLSKDHTLIFGLVRHLLQNQKALIDG